MALTPLSELLAAASAGGDAPCAVAAVGRLRAFLVAGGGSALTRARAGCLDVEAAALTLGNGSNDVLEMVARAFLGAGKAAVFSEHAFAVYPLATRAVGARAVVVPARDHGHDLDAMAAACSDQTRVIFVANPNNPTGTWTPRPAIEELLRRMPSDALLVVDEAYHEYVEVDGYRSCVELVADQPRLIVTRTFSKAHGLAALRIGYAVSHPQVADLLNRVRQPFNVNVAALAAAEAALGDEGHLQHSREVNAAGMRQLMVGARALGLDFIPSVANFLTIRMPQPGADLYPRLLRRGVIVRPVGGGYGLPMHLRVSIGTERENRVFLDALAAVLAESDA